MTYKNELQSMVAALEQIKSRADKLHAYSDGQRRRQLHEIRNHCHILKNVIREMYKRLPEYVADQKIEL